MDLLDPTLQRIGHEAERIAPCPLKMSVHGAGETALLVIEPVGLAPYPSSQLHRALQVFCDREGLPSRFLVVSSTQPGWVPKAPEGWPPTQI